jgi:hypothetical protein
LATSISADFLPAFFNASIALFGLEGYANPDPRRPQGENHRLMGFFVF